MTSFQKVIKYLAIALAFTIIISIISAIFAGTTRLVNIFTPNKNNNSKELSIIESTTLTPTSLDIELNNTKLIIKNGNKLQIKTNNDKIKYKESNNHLSITEKDNVLFFNDKEYELIVIIPSSSSFSDVEIESDAGEIVIEEILTHNLSMDLGAGKVDINKLNVLNKAEIDGGAGKINIKSGTLNNLELDMGIGELTVNSILKGNSKIEAGVGNIALNIDEPSDNYTIKLDKGIGSVKIDGKDIVAGTTFGTGTNNLKIDGGIGNIYVNFNS